MMMSASIQGGKIVAMGFIFVTLRLIPRGGPTVTTRSPGLDVMVAMMLPSVSSASFRHYRGKALGKGNGHPLHPG